MNRTVGPTSRLSFSPKPARSPSPDLVNKNIITSTRNPVNQELVNFLNNRSISRDVPLLEQLNQLRQENQELRRQLMNKSGVNWKSQSNMSRDQQINRLLEEIKMKDMEIQSLKQGSASKITSSKKINLTINNADNSKGLTDRIRELMEENKRLREQMSDPMKQSGTLDVAASTDEVRFLKRRLREAEDEREALKRELAKRSRVQTEPADISGQRNEIEMRRAREEFSRVREEVFRMLDSFKQNVNIRLDEIDGRVFDLMRQNTALMRSRPKAKDQGSTANSKAPERDPVVSNRTQPSQINEGVDFNTPDRFQPKTVVSHYVTEQSEGAIEGVPQPPSTINFQYELKINDLKRELSRKDQDNLRLMQELQIFQNQNKKLKEQIDFLNNELRRSRSASSGVQPNVAELNENIRRLQRQNSDLRLKLSNSISLLDQKTREQLQQDGETADLKNVINDLSNRLEYLKIEKNHEINRLQGDNQLLRQTVQGLRRQQNDMERQLQKSVASTTAASQQLNYNEIVRLKAEVNRLQSENVALHKEKALMMNANQQSKLEQSSLMSANHELTRQLNDAIASLNQQRSKVSILENQITRMRSALDFMNGDLQQMNQLKLENSNYKIECQKLDRQNKQNEKLLASNSNEKAALLRQIDELNAKNQQIAEQLKTRQTEILQILETRKMPSIEAYLRELLQLQNELRSLNLDPLQDEINERSQRLKTLLSQKLAYSRIATKHSQDIEALMRENDRLRKEALASESKFIGLREENEKLRVFIDRQEAEKNSLIRQISQLKAIINEYINKEVVYQEGSLSRQAQLELSQMESQLRTTEENQQRSIFDITSLKNTFIQAIQRLDSISDKIRHEINQPVQKTQSVQIIRRGV